MKDIIQKALEIHREFEKTLEKLEKDYDCFVLSVSNDYAEIQKDGTVYYLDDENKLKEV